MKFESLFTKRTTICIVIMCLTLMCIGTFFDYQISIVLYDQSNWFGKIFAGYGQYPTSLAMSVCGTLLIYITKRKLSIKTILSYIGGIFLIANALFMAYFDPMQYIPELPIILNVLITSVCVGGLNFFVLRFVKGKERKEIVRFIQFTMFVIIGQLLFINIIKSAWGRPRMRMIASTKEASFQPWYIMGSEMKDKLMALGIAAEEFKSFPSGHTACAITALVFSTLPLIADKKSPLSKIIFIFGFIFAVIVGFSRLIMGAHFLTDVTMGFVVGCFVVFSGYYIFYERKS